MSATDDQLRQLDQRAATAAGDLHARAAARPAPPFDSDHATVTPIPAGRPGNRGRYLAVAAVVLVIAAVAGFAVAQSDHDDDNDKAKVISTDPRPFVAGNLPEGFQLAGAGEVDAATARSSGGSPIEAGPTEIYGPDPTDPKLAIAWYDGWDIGPTDEADGATRVALANGRTAYRFEGMGLGKHALWVRLGDRSVVLVTNADDAPWLEDLGTRVSVADDGAVELGGFDLPGGWRALGEGPDLISLVAPMIGTSATEPGHYVMYWRDQGQETSSSEASSDGSTEGSDGGQGAPDQLLPDPGSITISSTQGDEVDLYTARLVGDRSESVTVRGHDAVVTTMDLGESDPVRNVTWLERPGELIRVSGMGITEDELLAVAEDIQPADPAEWKDIVERSQLGEFDPGSTNEGDVLVGEGRFEDGTRWRLTATPSADPAYPDPTVHLSVAAAQSGDTSSASSGGGTGSEMGGTTDAIISTESVGTDGPGYYSGALLSAEVAKVEIRDADGKVLATPEIVEGSGLRGIAVAISSDTAVLVALAADGSELGRQDLDFQIFDDRESPEGPGLVEVEPRGSGETSDTTVPVSGSGSSSGSSSSSGSFSTSGSSIDSGSGSGG